MASTWDGVTRAETLRDDVLRFRHELANAAKNYDWRRLLELLSGRKEHVNATRPGGPSWYAPLHQVAHGGAPVDVAEQLILMGAWRTLRNAEAQKPIDIASRRGHGHLRTVLTPTYRHVCALETLSHVQAHFHELIRSRADDLIREHQLRLPELEPMLELERPEMWFPVPGMYGGFSYRLSTEAREVALISESWSRVVGGSGQRHEVTAAGVQLLEEGFV